jgi:branched-chain amino acid transport system permease protein
MVDFSIIMEQLINGLVLGSMYALVASGLTLIWGTMKMLNFAHGEFYMLGGFGLYFGIVSFHLPIWITLPAVLVIVFFIGALLERGMIAPLLGRPGWDVSAVVITLGIGIFIQNFAFKFWEVISQRTLYNRGTLKLWKMNLTVSTFNHNISCYRWLLAGHETNSLRHGYASNSPGQ